MACGCPTLVSNTTSLPEVCGNASIYVDPHDTNSIKNGLTMLITNPDLRSKLSKEGHNRLCKFENKQSVNDLNAIIDNLIF